MRGETPANLPNTVQTAAEIFDLAEVNNPESPGEYLLGLAVGWLQAQGRSLSAIQSVVEITYNISWEDARRAAEAQNAKRGSA